MMKNLIQAELLKLRTTRMFYGLALAAMAIPLVSVISAITSAGKSGGDPALSTPEGIRDVMSTSLFGGLLVLIIGILLMAGEFRHNTATSTFLISSDRKRVVVAKLAASALVGAALGLISVVITLTVALPWLATKHIHVDIFSRNVGLVLLGGLAAMTIFAVVGVGVGSLIRNQTAAVIVALIWLLVVDNLLVSFAHEIGKWTPVGSSAALAGASIHGLLPMWAGAVLFLAYGLAFAAAGTRFTMRRDVA
jgi:ABC-type transport system involved in multi-copper enzyme maturation permease subunit